VRVRLVWERLYLPSNWRQVHVNRPADRGHNILGSRLLYLAVRSSNQRLSLLHKDVFVLRGLEPPIHHSPARVERLAGRQLKVLLALKPLDLHHPIIICEGPHLFLVSAREGCLSTHSRVIQGLSYELVPLPLLRHALAAVFQVTSWNCAEI